MKAARKKAQETGRVCGYSTFEGSAEARNGGISWMDFGGGWCAVCDGIRVCVES